MPDNVDSETRSRIMSRVRAKNTRPEILTRRLLHRTGFRFRLHVKALPGTPDIVLSKYNAVIMVNGCFWHGHDCSIVRFPDTRAEWWQAKITRNRNKDAKNQAALIETGWRIAIVWECAITGRMRRTEEDVAKTLERWLLTNDQSLLVVRERRKSID